MEENDEKDKIIYAGSRIGLRDLAVVEPHASEHILADGHGRATPANTAARSSASNVP